MKAFAVSRPVRTGFAWLLAALLPFQVFTGLYFDLRGPLHFHVAEHDHAHDHPDVHAHGYEKLERHHHAPANASVVIVDDHAHSGLPGAEDGEVGWSSIMFAALTGPAEPVLLSQMSRAFASTAPPIQKTRLPPVLERPPRAAQA